MWAFCFILILYGLSFFHWLSWGKGISPFPAPVYWHFTFFSFNRVKRCVAVCKVIWTVSFDQLVNKVMASKEFLLVLFWCQVPATLGVDYRKGSSASENETSDGCAFPPLSGKTKEVVAPANPIKLKIRCDFKEGHKELMAAVVGKDSSGTKHDASAESMTAAATGSTVPLLQVPAQQQPSPQGLGLLGLAPPSPQTVPHLAAPVPSPSMNIVRPKTGRAKTNAELKKQLMEKRAVQYLKGQGDGGSQASSPATSHVDVNSPASVQADAPSPLSLQAEGLGSDILDTSEERSSTDRRSQVRI